MSCYIGDPDVIDHHGLIWGGLRPKTITRPTCRQCDNPTWSHTAFLSRFRARCRSPFWLHNRWSLLLGGGEPCGEPVISLHSHHVSLVQWTTCLLPITRDPGSNRQGGTYVKRDSPVSDVMLQGSDTFHYQIHRGLRWESIVSNFFVKETLTGVKILVTMECFTRQIQRNLIWVQM